MYVSGRKIYNLVLALDALKLNNNNNECNYSLTILAAGSQPDSTKIVGTACEERAGETGRQHVFMHALIYATECISLSVERCLSIICLHSFSFHFS